MALAFWQLLLASFFVFKNKILVLWNIWRIDLILNSLTDNKYFPALYFLPPISNNLEYYFSPQKNYINVCMHVRLI